MSASIAGARAHHEGRKKVTREIVRWSVLIVGVIGLYFVGKTVLFCLAIFMVALGA